MIGLALAQLRRRAGRYLALFFAVFTAVAVTIATAAIVQSLQATVNGLFDKPYSQTQAVATVRASDQTVAIEVLDQARSLGNPVAFDQQVSASVKERGSLYSATFIRGITEGPLQWRDVLEGHLPHGPGEVVVSDSAPIGTQLQLKVPAQEEDVLVTVVGRVEQSAQEQLIGTKALLADAPVVADWSRGTVNGELRIGEGSGAPQQTVASLKQSLNPAAASDIHTAQQHTAQLSNSYFAGRDRYFLLLTAFLIIVGVVAALVVFSAYSVIAGERRREFALLKAVGASKRQLLQSTTVESALLGAIAGGLAIPAGLWAARYAGKNSDLLGIRVALTEVNIEPLWLLVVFLLGIGISVASALPAATATARKPLVDSLNTDAGSANSTAATAVLSLLGLAGIAAGWFLFQWSEGIASGTGVKKALVASIAGAGSIVLGAVLLAAALLPAVIFAASRVMSKTPFPVAHVGLAFVGRQRGRAGALVAIVLAGTALVAGVLQGQQQLSTYLLEKSSNKGAVDVVVRALDNTNDPELADSLRATPGVAAVSVPTAVPIESEKGTKESLLALSLDDGHSVLRSPITAAAPGEVVLGINSPMRNTVKDGVHTTIKIQDQSRDVVVRYSEGVESFIDPALVPEIPAEYPAHLRPTIPQPAALIRVAGDYAQPLDSPTMQKIREVAAASPEQLSLQEAFSARKNAQESAERVLTLSSLMSIIATLIAGIGVLNTVTLMVRERQKDHHLLRSIGLTTGGEYRSLLWENAALVIPSAIIGATIGGLSGDYIARVLTKVPATPWTEIVLSSQTGLVVLVATVVSLGIVLATHTVIRRKGINFE